MVKHMNIIGNHILCCSINATILQTTRRQVRLLFGRRRLIPATMNYYRQRTMLMFKVWTDGMRNELMDDELSEWTLRPNRFRPPTPPVTDYIASSVVFVSFSHNNTCIEFAQHTGGLLFCLRHQPPATLFQLPHPVLYVVYYTVLYDTSSSGLSVMLMYAFNIKPWSSHLSSNSVRQLVV